MNESEGLPLTTERTTLRRIEIEDAEALLAIYGDEQNAEHDFHGAFNFEDVQQLIYSQSDIFLGDPGVPFILAVVETTSAAVVGVINFTIHSPEDRQGEVGFVFHRDSQGKGLAMESTRAAMTFGFEALGLHRIIAVCSARNERSWKLMERLGMRREAHFVHDGFVDGEWLDSFVYAILEDEWTRDSL